MQKGYAAGFEELIAFIIDQTPQNEVIGQALRREIRMYPEKAIPSSPSPSARLRLAGSHSAAPLNVAHRSGLADPLRSIRRIPPTLALRPVEGRVKARVEA